MSLIWRYVAGGLLIATLAAGGYSLWLRAELADQALDLADVQRERDNLKSELATAQLRIEQSRRANQRAAEALANAAAASRELEAIKDWIGGNEDAPIPDWFNDLLVRLGFGMRDAPGGGPN